MQLYYIHLGAVAGCLPINAVDELQIRASEHLYYILGASLLHSTLSDQWFIRVRDSWNAAVRGDGPTFSQVLDRGDQTEVDVKRGLYMASGHLADVDELVLALAGDRKDLETAKRVLRDKNAAQVADLKLQYQQKTKQTPYWPVGRSLDFDLFGAAPTKVGEKNPVDPWGHTTLAQGKAQGTDRLLLEDYTQWPCARGATEPKPRVAPTWPATLAGMVRTVIPLQLGGTAWAWHFRGPVGATQAARGLPRLARPAPGRWLPVPPQVGQDFSITAAPRRPR